MNRRNGLGHDFNVIAHSFPANKISCLCSGPINAREVRQNYTQNNEKQTNTESSTQKPGELESQKDAPKVMEKAPGPKIFKMFNGALSFSISVNLFFYVIQRQICMFSVHMMHSSPMYFIGPGQTTGGLRGCQVRLVFIFSFVYLFCLSTLAIAISQMSTQFNSESTNGHHGLFLHRSSEIWREGG